MATVSFVVIAACASAPAKTPSGAPASCASDGDCVVTDFAGCCACCKAEPRALPRIEAERQQHACASASCTACDERIECPKVTGRLAGFVARCKDGTCAAVPR